jgi:ABC-2 type transport system permease protein
MIGFDVWFRKEAMEIALTWRRYVLPVLVLLLAVLSPVLARVTPELLRSVASNDPGVVIQLPDPTATDAIRQWAQSISQIVSFAVIILAAGLVSNDIKEGTAQLALAKPLSRSAFLLAKALVMIVFVMAVAAVGAILCGFVTRAIFETVPARELALVTLAWLGFAAMMICVLVLLSTVLQSQAAAAGVGIGIYFVMSIAGLWEPASRYSPVGLLSGLTDLAAGNGSPVVVPMLTAILVGVIVLAIANWHFRRQPLR